MEFGIYAWVNIITGRTLIGQTGWTVGFHKRKQQYLALLRRDAYGKNNPHFQRSWKKYTEAAFEFRIIEIISVQSSSFLTEREQFWVDFYRALSGGVYNEIGPVNAARRGKKNSPEHTAALVASIKGKPSKLKGKKRPPEIGNKISASKKGMPVSDAERRRLKEIAPRGPNNHNYGKPVSVERKRQIATANGRAVECICGISGKRIYFISVSEAARTMKVSTDKINKSCRAGTEYKGFFYRFS